MRCEKMTINNFSVATCALNRSHCWPFFVLFLACLFGGITLKYNPCFAHHEGILLFLQCQSKRLTSYKLLTMKRPLVFRISMGRCLMMLLFMLTSIAALSQEAYSVFTEADSTLTFFYDNERSSRSDTSYSLNAAGTLPTWIENCGKVTRVVFDSTFVAARPTSTSHWFGGMARLGNIVGIKYLKTDSVTDMSSMFSYCSALATLDLSGFNTSKVTHMISMFNNCISLDSLDLSGFNTTNVTNMASMFDFCVIGFS